ncbi:aminoglycoside adenylyltransferase domain-containing protein [Laceyella sediminis]
MTSHIPPAQVFHSFTNTIVDQHHEWFDQQPTQTILTIARVWECE